MVSNFDRQQYNKIYGVKNREAILAQKKVYAKNNKEKIAASRKKYYSENKEEFLANQRAYYSDIKGRSKKILVKARERAKASGMEFTITSADIIIPERCPYLGLELTHYLGKGQLLTNSSIDRIDSSKGYIPGNVRIISRMANNMKSNSTREQREAFAKAVLNDLTL